jgi:hypothetical protein
LKKVAFVLGNGTSRKDLDLTKLKQNGTVYGCNAIYREYLPDYLVAVDTKMVLELNKESVQHRCSVWTNPNKAFSKFTGFNFFSPSKGWSSGPTALHMASDYSNDEVYILGFDYKGLGTNGEFVNNIYADTFNYKRSHERATYYGNWLKQTATTIQKFSKKRYIRVLGENVFVPNELSKLPNLNHISMDEFKKIFGIL